MEEVDSTVIQVLKALGHSKRVKILFSLRTREKNLDELNKALGTKGSHLFSSMNTLTAARLVHRIRSDKPTWSITSIGRQAIEIYQYSKQKIGGRSYE